MPIKDKSLADRIREHYEPGIGYWTLMRLVFPNSRSWRYRSNGGPPGCSISFNRELRRMGGNWRGMGCDRTVWIPHIAVISEIE